MTATTTNPAQLDGGVVTIGETMALLSSPAGRQLRGGQTLPIGFGGAESNVAIGLARLDVPATWISRVGHDAFGSLVTREIRSEGVRVIAATDTDANTGLMVKEHHHGIPSRVRYYRSGSAASRLSPDDLDEQAITDAAVLHVSGITAAIGPRPLEAIRTAITVARSASTLVSLDVNYRSTLWAPDTARAVLRGLAESADLLFAGPDEAALLLGTPAEPESPEYGEVLARGLAKLGPATIVVKLGALGALALEKDSTYYEPGRSITVLDAVGAGDAFVAGFLSELVTGSPIQDQLRTGNLLGSIVCQVPGDWEGLPTRSELATHLAGPVTEIIR